MNPIRVMGIDPGSFATGFGLIEWNRSSNHFTPIQQGVILLNSKDTFEERLLDLGKTFSELLEKYKPHHVVFERIFLGKNVDTAFKLGHVRGVLMFQSKFLSLKIFEYSPRLVRKTIVGHGAATKEEVRMALRRYLRWGNIQNLDSWDAMALAVYHFFAHEEFYFTRHLSKPQGLDI